MKRLAYFILFFTVIVSYTSFTYAGGWTQPKGKGYFKLSQQVVRADGITLPNGDSHDIPPTVSGYTTSLYGEFGILDRVSLVGYMPVYTNFSADLDGIPSSSGIGDWDVGVRIGLLTSGPTVVSLQAMAGLPLGDSGDDIVLWTGDGEFNQHVSIQVGHSLYPTPAYLSGSFGYNNRQSDESDPEANYADEFRYSLEAGLMLGERLGITAWLRGVEAVDRADDEFHPRNDIEYLSFGPEVNFNITPNAGITASMSTFTRSHNLLDAPVWEFGLFLKL